MNRVCRLEIEQRLGSADPLDLRVDEWCLSVGQENDTGLRLDGHHVPRAVVLLVGSGAFVLFDSTAVVLVERVAARQPRLSMAPIAQAVHIERRLRLDHQRGGATHPGQIRHCCLVHDRVVRIGAWRQIDFRSCHVQKAERHVGGERPCLLGADDVVGDSGHGRGRTRFRTKRAKWRDNGHRGVPVEGER